MKNKKIIAIVLAVIVLVGGIILIATRKTPEKALENFWTDIGSAEAISLSTLYTLEAVEDNEPVNLDINAKINKDLSNANVEINAKQGDKDYEVTDIILTEDKTIYFNIDNLVKFFTDENIVNSIKTEDDSEYDSTVTVNMFESIDMFSKLNLPTYLSIPEDENNASNLMVSISPDDSEFLFGMAKSLYAEIIKDKNISSYNRRTKTVTITIDETAVNTMTTGLENYYMENNENLYNYFSEIVVLYPDESIDNIMTVLKDIIPDDEAKNSEAPVFSESSSATLLAFLNQHENDFKDIKILKGSKLVSVLSEETKSYLKEITVNPITIKIGLKDTYTIAIETKKQNNEELSCSIEIITLEEKIVTKAPKDVKSVENIMLSMFAAETTTSDSQINLDKLPVDININEKK